jgi:RNA polymerase-binding transcription factor DksA
VHYEQPYLSADLLPPQDVVAEELANKGESLDRLIAELDAVEATLQRLTTDDAGRCEVCGAEIAMATLREQPLSARCDDHLLPA